MTKRLFIAGHNGMVGSALMRQLEKNKDTKIITARRQDVDLCNQQQVADFFANNPTVLKSSLVANVNVDMPLLSFPQNTITAYGAENSSLGEPTKAEVALEGFKVGPDPYPGDNSIGRSDQYSFAVQGIPFIYLVAGVESPDPGIDGLAIATAFTEDRYHQLSDDLSQPLDWDTARRFTRASARLTRRIAMDDAAPTWNEGDFFGEKFGQ